MTNKAEVCGWQPKGNSEDIPKPPKFNTDKLSVEKLQEQLNTAKKALTKIAVIPTKFDDGGAGEIAVEIAHDALAAIGGEND
ncbi:hypothetical protein [Lactococcus lactis]|uniref:hypothetical protein n=1 Tax=Lactococcus lactis TaxID=1358 RepID=UPI0026581C20|nr:hypothetical protein [Lactococcus lactis]WKG34476.1 hypothetical protein QZH48_09130 [Lactococcus lactis subsp. lactis]WKG35948.1 hypothetical protein QZH48_04815 [Lactococcus lactis subsp. lactis]